MDNNPLVSVIIPTYNSAQTLPRCLKSLKGQTYKNIEVIVIDKHSNDNTTEISKKYKTRLFFTKGSWVIGKTIGIKHSKGKYLCFIDSDMMLTPNVIKECVKLAENKKIGIIIPERTIGNSYWSKVRDFERSFYFGTPIESARFFEKDLVIKVKGFDKRMLGFEDSTLPQKLHKLGYKTDFRIKSIIWHMEYNFNLLKWLKKKYYYGGTNYKYRKDYPKYANMQLNPKYRLSILIFNKKFYLKPQLAIGVLTLKTLEYISISLGGLFGHK